MPADDVVLPWLLDSDPALRWQVERDLAGAPEAVWRATRAQVATSGFGARLLALQDPDGQWAGGAFFPAGFDGSEPGQPWTATTWSLNALREWGVDAAALGDTAQRLATSSRWEYEGLPYWGGEVDVCINASTLRNGVWLGVDMAPLARWFVEHRMAEGGWNCEWVEGSTRASFHSTLNAVKALREVEPVLDTSGELRAARHAGEEYLLERRLLERATTGEPVGGFTTEITFPFRWRYNVLSALDHFRAAALQEGAAPDPRLADAIAIVRDLRKPDGTWIQGPRQEGRVWFDVDVPEGLPSRWLTFVGTRVLRWWDAAR